MLNLYRRTLSHNNGLKKIKNNTDYYIFTDSLSTITSFQNLYRLDDVASSLIKQVHKLQIKNNSINFIWLPERRKIPGNDEVEYYVKCAAIFSDIENWTL